ncbi:MAG: DUF494 family protein [Candidatus Omnitrophica bacterium]|nr:DUF494 family protein [Candidatus Omnitrophota bacterium]MCB9769966.1 DUF494 family protein [Candidatus Omnitrophota bacterium]
MTARVLEILNLFLQRSVEGPFDMEDREEFVETLVAQGHHPDEVYAALNIVDNIQQRMDAPILGVSKKSSNRLFMLLEQYHLTPELRGHLDELTRLGVITPVQREEIVERSFLMEPEEITVEHIEYLVEDMISEEPNEIGYFDETISEYYH